MVRRIVAGIACLLATPVAAQFGVAGKQRKAGSTFQEINEMAKEQQAGVGAAIPGLEGLGDMEEVYKQMAEAMNDPEVMKMMEGMGDNLQKAMEDIQKMSPDQVMAQMQEALTMLTEGDIVESVLGQREEVLKTLEAQGAVDEAKLKQYRENPELFEAEMRASFSQMKDIFSDPETLMKAGDLLSAKNPEDILSYMSENFKDDLDNDEKIEEARLTLLANPEMANNPGLAAILGTDEMSELLKDPVKWRESVKEGQEIFLGTDDSKDEL